MDGHTATGRLSELSNEPNRANKMICSAVIYCWHNPNVSEVEHAVANKREKGRNLYLIKEGIPESIVEVVVFWEAGCNLKWNDWSLLNTKIYLGSRGCLKSLKMLEFPCLVSRSEKCLDFSLSAWELLKNEVIAKEHQVASLCLDITLCSAVSSKPFAIMKSN